MIALMMMGSSRPLPRLREDLEFLPSPLSHRPGLIIRDPYRYSDACMVVPPLLTRVLELFDGRSVEGDLSGKLARLLSSSTTSATDVAARLMEALSSSGFLHDSHFHRLREQRLQAFAVASERAAAHAGSGYPGREDELSTTMAAWVSLSMVAAPMTGTMTGTMTGPRSATSPDTAPAGSRLVGIAAPHASPGADPATYAVAYAELGPELAESTFVILGTSHYGAPNRLGLTRKPFQTPLGRARTATSLVDELLQAAPGAFEPEDYCHAIEHSIEFQVLFLQNRFGPEVRILPILCGPFFSSAGRAQPPESDAQLARAFAALSALHARHDGALCWVLGIDMAHVGRRYGDAVPVQAYDASMNEVATRDRQRLDTLVDGDAKRFWEEVNQAGADDLRWCGAAPLYAFLQAVPGARARLLRYHQWNIDEASVVSFAALSFHAAAR
jgi:AmmeMemoRadiSam system protein B